MQEILWFAFCTGCYGFSAFSALCLVMILIAKLQKRILKNEYKTGVLYFIFMLVFLLLPSCCGKLTTPSVSDETAADIYKFETEKRYTELLETVSFQSFSSNTHETDWEYLLRDGLSFSSYESMAALSTSLCDLRNRYYGNVSSPLYKSVSQTSTESLYQMINKYYGSSILPETDLTLEEIEARILPLSQRMSTPISDVKAETYIRAMKCQESQNPSRDMLYQTARAADDTVKILANNGGSPKEILFFSYIAINFYILSLPCEGSQISDTFIYYRIAKIYLHLYIHSGYDTESDYSKHFLLSAEAYMHLAVETWPIEYKDSAQDPESNMANEQSIFDTMPEYAYDYACILDSFYSVYSCNNQKTKDDCVKYATAHIEHYGADGRYYTDCLHLINKYSVETDA